MGTTGCALQGRPLPDGLFRTGPRSARRVSPGQPGSHPAALGTRGSPDAGVARPSPILASLRMGSGISTFFGVLAVLGLTGRPSSRPAWAAAGEESWSAAHLRAALQHCPRSGAGPKPRSGRVGPQQAPRSSSLHSPKTLLPSRGTSSIHVAPRSARP